MKLYWKRDIEFIDILNKGKGKLGKLSILCLLTFQRAPYFGPSQETPNHITSWITISNHLTMCNWIIHIHPPTPNNLLHIKHHSKMIIHLCHRLSFVKILFRAAHHSFPFMGQEFSVFQIFFHRKCHPTHLPPPPSPPLSCSKTFLCGVFGDNRICGALRDRSRVEFDFTVPFYQGDLRIHGLLVLSNRF